MTVYHADSAAARLLQLLLLCMALLVCIAAAYFFRSYPLVLLICNASAVAISLLGCIGFPLYIRSLRCIISSSQITVRHGVFLRREQSVLLRSIQFVRIIHGPFDGAWGLNFIVLHVYGGMLGIAFLSRRDRMALTEFLRQKGVFHAP